MFTLIAENKYGQQLELTNNDAYVIKSIDGLDPPDAQINTTKNANDDGSIYNSSYLNNRVITITLAINGPAEANRINLYKYFNSKSPVILYYQNDTRDVYIEGYVRNMPIAFFDKKQVVQITIVCPKPLFNGTAENITEFANVESLFEFPFSIEESKNLLPNTMNSQTLSDIDFTVNDDGTVTASGTSTDYTWTAYVNEDGISLAAGSYVLSGCPTGGSSTTYRLQAFSGDPSNPTLTVNDYGDSADFTLTETTIIKVRMLIKGEIDAMFSPMIRLASVEDSSYQEYNNPDGTIEFSEIVINEETDVLNGGDIDTGAIITLRAEGSVTNPSIYNVETNEYFVLNLTMNRGDVITINTKKKEKSVTLLSNGETTNIVGKIKSGSTWFQLVPGDNVFIVTAEALPENMFCTFAVVNQFEGV